MEILGDDEAGLPTPPVRRSAFADPFADALALDEPHPDDVPRDGVRSAPPSAPDDDPPPTRVRLLTDTLLGPEALGLSGLLVAVTGAVTTSFSPFVLMFRTDVFGGSDVNASVRSVYSPIVLAFAAVALALGVGAVLRVRPASPAWVRGLAGATVILAVLMLVATGWALWDAETGTPVPTG